MGLPPNNALAQARENGEKSSVDYYPDDVKGLEEPLVYEKAPNPRTKWRVILWMCIALLVLWTFLFYKYYVNALNYGEY